MRKTVIALVIAGFSFAFLAHADLFLNPAPGNVPFQLSTDSSGTTHVVPLNKQYWTLGDSGTSAQFKTLSTSGCTGCGGGSSTAILNVDGNRTDPYTVTGSYLYPYKSFSAAIASSTGYQGYVYNLSPGTYVDGAPDTFPNTPFYISGNESTYVPASGVTMPNSFDIYDLTVVGNVLEADTSTQVIHQFNNGSIVGSISMAGNATLQGMAFPVTTSTITIQPGALSEINGSFIQSSLVDSGVLNVDNSQVQLSATTTSGFGIFASSTGSQVILNGMTGIFTNPSLKAVSVNNGATSTENVILNAGFIVATSTPGATLTAGSAATMFCNNGPLVNALTGAFVPPTGTNWQPCYDEERSILAGLSVGTSTVNNFLWVATPTSTVRIGVSGTPGCTESYDSVTATQLDYVYYASAAQVVTTTKPTFCQ